MPPTAEILYHSQNKVNGNVGKKTCQKVSSMFVSNKNSRDTAKNVKGATILSSVYIYLASLEGSAGTTLSHDVIFA